MAEGHVGRAVDRLGSLVDNEDPKVALEASQIIVHLARLRQPGEGLGDWRGGGSLGIEWGDFFGFGGVRGG